MFEFEKLTFYWVNRLGFLIRKKIGSRFQQAGFEVRPEEWALLLVLWGKGPQTPSALADRTIKDRTTVTRLIDAMVRKGVVARTEDPNDRRKSVVSLTKRGAALQHDLVPMAQSLIAQATTGISSQDIETTTRTLRAMTENLLVAHDDDRKIEKET